MQPYNVLYALCRDHHPQYCRFIEEMREDIADKDKEIVEISCKALGEINNPTNVGNEMEWFQVQLRLEERRGTRSVPTVCGAINTTTHQTIASIIRRGRTRIMRSE